MKLTADNLHFEELNRCIRQSADREILLEGVNGQRYIGCGTSDKMIQIDGTPGNALGAYLDGGMIEVFGNAQDATGDTMNGGEIRIHGSAGDATGYAMRGGAILIQGDTGYRAGIHMKAYREKQPALVVGGCAGSFLGEYLAGGAIVVLGAGAGDGPVVGHFCGTGMHGGRIFLRCKALPPSLPEQIAPERCSDEMFAEIFPLIDAWRKAFRRQETFSAGDFWRLTPNTKNPYRKLYTQSDG